MERLKAFLNWRWAPWCVAGGVLGLAFLLTLLFVGTKGDVVMRYAPMAEAVANGEWQYAFHPRFGVGFPLLSGAWVWLTGEDGLMACVHVSMVAWALCMPILFCLVERLFDRRTAWVALALYAVCPMLFRWAFEGFREPFRTLAMLLAVVAILERREGMSGLLKMAVAVLILCTFRADTILIAAFVGMVYAYYDRFRLKTWSLVLWGVLCLQPTSWLAWSWTGVWLPSVQIVHVWQRLMEGVL